MRFKFALTLFLFSQWLPICGQQEPQPVRRDVTETSIPVLLPSTPTVSTPKHCDELDGVIKFGAEVDPAGIPQDLRVLEASDRRLVDFATELVKGQRFEPAMLNGTPMAVSIELTVGLHTCAQHERDPNDPDFYRLTLRSHPMMAFAVVTHPAADVVTLQTREETLQTEQIGPHISPPVPTVITDPKLPVSRRLPKRGFCLVAVTIGENGIPSNVRIFRSLEPELDGYAMEAAKNWRFNPALRDGSVPVAVEGTILATFEYIDKEPVAFAIFNAATPEKIGNDIAHHQRNRIAVKVVNSDEVSARYAPHRRIPGHCLVSLVIDKSGLPHNVHIVKGIDSGLDMDTVAMIEHSQFKVTMPDGNDPTDLGLIISIHYPDKVLWKDMIADLLPFVI